MIPSPQTADYRLKTTDYRTQIRNQVQQRARAKPWLRSAVCSLQSEPWGFSLVELVVAMAILGVGLVGAIRVFPVGLRASQRAEVRSRAVMAAQRTLEWLKLKPCDEVMEGEEAVDGLLTVTTRVSTPSLHHLVDAGRLKGVEVAVGWAQNRQPRHLTFVTYLRCDASDGTT